MGSRKSELIVCGLAGRLATAAALCTMLLACSTAGNQTAKTAEADEATLELAEKGDRAAAPGQSIEKTPRRGPRAMVGKAYQVAGRWFEPKEDPDYDRTGTASWYGPTFHGRRTANGEVFDRTGLTAAHPTLPLPSYVRVTNLQNERSIVVRVNDRGPFSRKRLIDVSERTAELLDFKRRGMAQVRVEYVDKAQIEGDDAAFLLASYRGPAGATSTERSLALASAAPPKRREGISHPPPVVPPRRPATELAFGEPAQESAGPTISDAVLVLEAPVSPESRIMAAFDTASPSLE